MKDELKEDEESGEESPSEETREDNEETEGIEDLAESPSFNFRRQSRQVFSSLEPTEIEPAFRQLENELQNIPPSSSATVNEPQYSSDNYQTRNQSDAYADPDYPKAAQLTSRSFKQPIANPSLTPDLLELDNLNPEDRFKLWKVSPPTGYPWEDKDEKYKPDIEFQPRRGRRRF